MQAPIGSSGSRISSDTGLLRIGCVSFLNARPLIEDLDQQFDVQVRFDVPSGLLADLESRRVDVALCPIIDFQTSNVPLKIVPSGGIGCVGPTLTVRLLSHRPFDEIDTVFADTDSHTSIALLQVIMHHRYGRRIRVTPFDAREHVADGRVVEQPQSVLLIGDKVVSEPTVGNYPHQLDLGQAWHEMTGLPFVFATWMAHVDAELGDLPIRLRRVLQQNMSRLETIVQRHATQRGWEHDLAMQYLGKMLCFDMNAAQLEGIERFYRELAQLGLISELRPINLQ